MRTFQCWMNNELKEVREIWSEEAIRKRIKTLAAEIYAHYNQIWKEGETITIVAILDGAIFFAADLLRELSQYFPVGALRLETFAVYSYRRDRPGKIRFDKDTKNPLEGTHILIVEDIVDTGQTLQSLITHFRTTGGKSVRVCVLIDKRGRRKVKSKINFAGFILQQGWYLIGYGLDWGGFGRELSWIGRMIEIKKEG